MVMMMLVMFTKTGKCQVEAEDLESFLRTGKELGLKGLLEDTIDNKDLGMVPVMSIEECDIANDAIEKSTLVEMNKESNKPEMSNVENSLDVGLSLNENSLEDDKTSQEQIPMKAKIKEDVEIQYKCLYCKKSFSSKQRLRTHTEMRHGTDLVTCNSCEYTSFSEKAVLRHQRSVHEGIRYNCDQCPFQATSQGNVTVHKKNKHEGLRYQCNQCDLSVTQYHNLVKHKKSKHEGVVYKCQHCHHEVKTEASLKKHISTVHEGKWLQCDICDYRSAHVEKLKQHNKAMHL